MITHLPVRILVLSPGQEVYSQIRKSFEGLILSEIEQAKTSPKTEANSPSEENVSLPDKAIFAPVLAQKTSEAVDCVRFASAEGKPFVAVFLDLMPDSLSEGLAAVKELLAADDQVHAILCVEHPPGITPEQLASVGDVHRVLLLRKPLVAMEVLQLSRVLAVKSREPAAAAEAFPTDAQGRVSENDYQLLFEQSPTPKFIYDRDTLAFLAVNQAAVKHYGYSSEEFTKLTLRDILSPTDLSAFQTRLEHVPGQGGSAGIWTHRRSNGKTSEMAITALALEFRGRKAWISLALDVSERLSLEAQLRQSQKMESIGMLAGGVAHDFNNLLTVIQGHAGLAAAVGGIPPRVTDSLREITQAAKRAADLTRQLLTFSRKQTMQPQSVDLNEVITNVTKMLRRVLGEDITLESAFSEGLTPVKADIGMLEQVMLNMAVNSRDAMPKGGKLRISTFPMVVTEDEVARNSEARPGNYVVLGFEDTGCGISPENLPRIFEPFFTTKELDRGTGLGLATVYGIIKQHQGWIEVSSQVDNGTNFCIFLPASSHAEHVSPNAAGVSLPEIGGTETILVVEDEEPLLKLMKHILESYGYKVHGCMTGKEALNLWENHRQKIELLLTDMVLPDGMAGPDLAELLKLSKPSLKVIFTSGYDSGKFPVYSPALQGANFLQKPFHARKLAEKVHDCLAAK